ncbi:SBBP repeat-containing protein [Aurantibacillus circumpalustris]|uniref:SBBP repeat-containing protein n=1 Tax=Aurantibacillus circumpalustris TaxID=3036359 RepID=UPI00295BA883|nr:SBBP repeat-containing protein [Aurantibacillus circumpalustris]
MTNLKRHSKNLSLQNVFCKLIITINLFNVFSLVAQPEWAKQMGGPEGDIGACTAADLLGNIYSIGTFSGTSTFGTYNLTSDGKGDIFIAKSSAIDGKVKWAKRMGGSNEDVGNAIVCDPSGNIYFTGRFSGMAVFGSSVLTSNGSSDSFLAKLDSLGTILWVKKIGGTGNDGGLSLASDLQGNIFTCGYFQGIANFGTFTINPIGTNYNIFLMRTNTTGNVAWVKNYGSSGYSIGTSVSCDAAGDVYMTGNFESAVTLGSYTLSSEKYQDIFISKHYGSTGNVAWASSSGGSGNDNGNGIVAGSDGYVFTTGKFENSCAFSTTTLTSIGSADMFISKRNASDGSLIWVHQFGATGYEQGSAIAQDQNGYIYVAGQFSGFVGFDDKMLISNGNTDAFLIKLKKDAGTVQWALGMGGLNVDCAYGICVGLDEALFCTGFFQSNADLAGFKLVTNGLTDAFVLKLTSTTVGIEEIKSLNSLLQISPQPFSTELNISMNKQNLKPYQLSLTDLSGKIIFQFNSNQTEQHLNLESLAAGIYILSIQEKMGEKVFKKIIKN